MAEKKVKIYLTMNYLKGLFEQTHTLRDIFEREEVTWHLKAASKNKNQLMC